MWRKPIRRYPDLVCHRAASGLTGDEWGYVKVPEKVFYASTASSLEQLTRHIEALTK